MYKSSTCFLITRWLPWQNIFLNHLCTVIKLAQSLIQRQMFFFFFFSFFESKSLWQNAQTEISNHRSIYFLQNIWKYIFLEKNKTKQTNFTFWPLRYVTKRLRFESLSKAQYSLEVGSDTHLSAPLPYPRPFNFKKKGKCLCTISQLTGLVEPHRSSEGTCTAC